MEKHEHDYHSLLWNQYEILHNIMLQKSAYFEGKKKFFKDILAEYTKFTDNMKKYFEGDTKQKCPKEISFYQEILDIFISYANSTLNNHKKIIENIYKLFSRYFSRSKNEKIFYNELKDYLPKYNSEKDKFLKIKEKYHKSALQSEKSLLKFNKENLKKNKKVNIPKKYFKETLENLKKYQRALEDVNDKRNILINKQNTLIDFHVKMNKNEFLIYYDILENFLKIERQKSLEFFYKGQVSNLITIYNKRNIKKETWEKLSEFQSNEKPDKIFTFEQYQSNIDFDKCKENEEFKINVETVKMIKSKLDNAFNDFTVEREENKKNMRELLEKLFNGEEEITETNKQTFMNYLEDTATHHLFLVVLSKLRINNDFKKDKKLINLLSESIVKILDKSESILDYRNARNCLILSQTFYYEEEGKKKYIFESIKNNQWLNSIDFWRVFILKMIEEEIKKFSELHYKDENYIKLNKKNELPEKMNKRISDILFSQLITYITNMNEFNIDKKYIVQIVDEFAEKYNYLSNQQIEGILSAVSHDKEEIERLRKEYKKENCELILSKSQENLLVKFENENNNDKDNINMDLRKSAINFEYKAMEQLNNGNNINVIENNNNSIISSDKIHTIGKQNNNNEIKDIDEKDCETDSIIESKSNTMNDEEEEKK